MVRSIAVIDAETDPFKRGRVEIKPFIWGYYNGKTYEEFADFAALPEKIKIEAIESGMRDFAEFIPFLEEQEIIVYAHNGGKFDYHFLLDYLEPFEPITIIGGRLAKFKIGLCEFRDSFNIIPVGLDKWQKEVFDYSILEVDARYKPVNWKKIREYLYSDCINLYNMVTAFIDRFGFHLTQATASMKYWQQLTGEKAPNSGRDFYLDFHPFYYGGRVECFESGLIENDFSLIDINSAYPYAMLSQHPISLTYSVLNEWDKDNITGSDFYHIKAVAHGSLPFRADDKSLLFPNDREVRNYHITGWELQAAIDTETIDRDIKLITRYSFHELIDFKAFIIPLYEERKIAKEGKDTATDLFNKLHMNGLYGKFAANPDEYGEFIVLDGEFTGVFDAIRNGTMKRGHLIENLSGYEFAGELGPWVMGRRDLDEEKQRYYNVATAASITGFVRAYLWRAVCRCGGVLYCDTDSIAARDVQAIQVGNEMGEWSIDGLFSRGAIAGKKLYAYRHKGGTEPKDKNGKNICWKIASKGGRLSAKQIVRICKGERVLFEPETPTFSIFKEPRLNNRNFTMTAKIMPNLNKK